MAPEVSVVLPARDEAASIGACLDALARQTVGAATLEVIVVAAGRDDTAAVAERVAGRAGFGRFELVPLVRGNKNVALQAGCARASAPFVVLLDADTELAPDAIAELTAAVSGGECVVHGAPLPRFDTWVSRYWELNRKLRKDLRFDGTVSGEVVALRRETLASRRLADLFPERQGPKSDLHFGRALAASGCPTAYVPAVRAVTNTPWTLRGLARTMMRSRRGMMALVTAHEAAAQAALSAALVAGAPAAALACRWSVRVAALCLAPLAVYVGRVVRDVRELRRRGLGDHRRALPTYLALDLLGRAIKVWAYAERVAGRGAPYTFRGERAGELGADPPRRAA